MHIPPLYWVQTPVPVTPPVKLMLSTSADRSVAVTLQGSTLITSGSMVVFTSPDTGVKSVTFWLDSATPAKPAEAPAMVENLAPFDFAGTDAQSGLAKVFSLSSLAIGLHTITAQVTNTDGTTRAPVTASFTVSLPPLDTAAISARLSAAMATLQAIRDQMTASGIK